MDRKTVEKIADLARLELTETEISDYSEQLTHVMEYFDQIQAADTTGVKPLYNPAPSEEGGRSDLHVSSLGADELLSNAPDRSGNLFRVPNVV